jgi:AAA+ superfamily predicted ATPase
VRRNQDKQAVMAKLHLILKNHEIAIHRGEPQKAKMKEVTSYCIDSLNLSEKPQTIIDTLQNYLDGQAAEEKTIRSMNLLFYGSPGTGKTEFAKYLSMALDREIRLKRASDLISKYVGESEKLIAEAFEEAAQDGAILFLDEADTFFYPRGMAQHSWEKSQTNELLTQMENYNGILICATNMKDGLDDAALRRFKYKVEFKALTGEGVIAMYQAMMVPLVPDPLKPEEVEALANIAGLAHGDFFVVSEKYSLRKDKATHADLIASLHQELAHKKKTPRIGFRIAG